MSIRFFYIVIISFVLALCPKAFSLSIPAQNAILTTLNASHPRIFASAAEFAALKTRIQADSNSAVAKMFSSVKSWADGYLTSPVLVYNTPDGLSVSRWFNDRIKCLALSYQITGDAKYAQRAWTEVANAAAFPDWVPSKWLDVAEMEFGFAIAFDWLYSYLSSGQRDTLWAALNTKGFASYLAGGSWFDMSGNWSFVCHGGTAVAALATAERDTTQAKNILFTALTTMTRTKGPMDHFVPDGTWFEGPGYWDYATQYLFYAIISCQSSMGTDFGISDMPGLSNTGNFGVFLCGPSGACFNFADAAEGAESAPWLFWMGKRYNNHLFSWYQVHHLKTDAMNVVWYDSVNALPSSVALDAHFTDPFDTCDIVTMRSAWGNANAVFTGLKAGAALYGHSHLDIGSFVLDANGQRWASDLGPDDYNLPNYFNAVLRWNYYRMRAEGHNTLVINPTNGVDQVLSSISKIIRFQSSKDRSAAVTDMTPAYSSSTSRVWRGVSLFNNRSQVLVQDEITAKSPAETYWFMTTKAAIAIDTSKRKAVLTINGKYLQAQICSPTGATFDTMAARPLPTSPNPTGQAIDTPYIKLMIHMTKVDTLRLAVLLAPIATSGQTVTPPKILPLSDTTWPGIPATDAGAWSAPVIARPVSYNLRVRGGNISFSLNRPSTIKLINIKGNVLRCLQSGNTGNQCIHIDGVSAGMYVLRIEAKGSVSIRRLLVVQ